MRRLTVFLSVLAFAVGASTALAATSEPIDEGTGGTTGPCDAIVGNGVPDCSGSSSTPGAGIPCYDPSLPCEHGGESGSGTPTPAPEVRMCDYQIVRVTKVGTSYDIDADMSSSVRYCPWRAGAPLPDPPFHAAALKLVQLGCDRPGDWHAIIYETTATGATRLVAAEGHRASKLACRYTW